MKRASIVLAAVAVAACAVVGSAATLGVTTHKLDAFAGNKPAAAPATGSSCTTGTPVAMSATAPGLYVTSQNNRLYQYTWNGSAFAADGDSSLVATNVASAGVGVGANAVYVVDAAERKVYRYNTDRTSSATSPRTLAPAGQPRGLSVDQANNELWTVTRDAATSTTRLRCYLLDQVFTGSGDLSFTREITLPAFSPATTDPQGMAMDGTYIYLVDGTNKRVSRTARTTGASTLGDATSFADAPRGAEIRAGALYVAGDKKKIARFADVGVFFDATAATVAPSPAPVDLSHNQATGM